MKVELSNLEACYLGIALTQMRKGNLRPMEIVAEEILSTNDEEKKQRFREEKEHVRQYLKNSPSCTSEPDVPNGHHSPTIEFADDF